MITKEIAKQTIDKLPNNADYNDIINALYIQAKFELGKQEIINGKGITQEEVRQRLEKWVR